MHEVGCARSNYKCAVCGEIVAKIEKEEHDKEAHLKVKCEYCPHEADKKSISVHEGRCEMRPKMCKFCEQTFDV